MARLSVEDEESEPTPVELTAGGPGPGEWLVLVYRIPSEPTRLRATAWRRLKGLGAVYLQNSVAALPATAQTERALRKLRHDIVEMSGTALLLSASAMVGEADLMATYQAARDDEYEEIIDRCQDFLAQVAKEHVARHFTFAELEENEVDLVKLLRWFEKIRERDVFGAPTRAATEAALAECAKVLEDYASRVYQEESEGQ
ncbi:MAG TPA: Chromate resistance protein ChrB [Acidimicrobiales bacterium]|nr:Chromate resistance protein ChrB [Acidimicrobiales bacterium]